MNRKSSYSLILLSILLAFFLAEGALRIIGFSHPNFYVTDETRGMALRPGAEGWWTREGKGYVSINADGMRDEAHAIEKPLNTYRIALLGDSTSEALQVNHEETYGSLLEQKLQECPVFSGKKIEVLNFGVSGYGTAHELLTLRTQVWKYSPDLVLLGFFSGNDIRDNSRVLDQDHNSPYFVLKNGKLNLDRTFYEESSFRWRQFFSSSFFLAAYDHSKVLQLLNRSRSQLKKKRVMEERNRLAQEQWEEQGLDDLIYEEPRHAPWQEAWQVTEALLIAMQQEVKASQALFALVTLTNPIQVHPESSIRQAYMAKRQLQDLFYPDKRIARLGERQDFPVINLAEKLQPYAEKKHLYLHGFSNTKMGLGHWNAEGHKAVAALLAEELCKGLSS